MPRARVHMGSAQGEQRGGMLLLCADIVMGVMQGVCKGEAAPPPPGQGLGTVFWCIFSPRGSVGTPYMAGAPLPPRPQCPKSAAILLASGIIPM